MIKKRFFRPIVMALTLLPVMVFAQPGTIIPGLENGQPPSAEAQNIIDNGFQLPSVTGYDIAVIYRDLTGKRVIISSAASSAEIRIIQPGPFTSAVEATTILEKILVIEGWAIVPSGKNEVKLLLGGTNNPKSEAPIITQEADLPEEGDQIVTYMMSFVYLKPDQAQNIFTQIIGNFGVNGSVTILPNVNALAITENTAVIRKLVKLKKIIDKPSAQVIERWVSILYADAEGLVQVLNGIYSQSSNDTSSRVVNQNNNASSNQNPNVSVNPTQNNNAPNNSGVIPVIGEEIAPTIIAETRTNRILLKGTSAQVDEIESVIRQFDIKNSQENWLQYRLNYVTVSDFLPLAQDALARIYETGNAADTGSNRTTINNNQNNQNNSGANTGVTQSQTEAPESILVGRAQIVADNISNTIIVNAPPEGLALIRDLINRVDIKPDRVAISAVFGQYGKEDNLDFALDYTRALTAIGNNQSFQGSSQTRVATDQSSALTAVAANGLNLLANLGSRNTVALNLLESESNFKTLARPIVYTTNNRQATLSAGQEVAFQNQTVGVTTLNNTIFREVELTLEVIPRINANDEVTLDVVLSNDSVASINADGSPNLNTQSLTTTVTVGNGETVILGGLISKEMRETESGIPLLRKLPLIGELFQSTNFNEDFNELIIFIQPQIVRTKEDQKRFEQSVFMGVELTEEIVAEYKKLGKESKKSRKKRQKIK